MAVEFVDAPPPKSGREGGELQNWLDEVRKRPGKWAKRTYKNQSSASSSGQLLKLRGFETTTRGADLYVRWPKA